MCDVIAGIVITGALDVAVEVADVVVLVILVILIVPVVLAVLTVLVGRVTRGCCYHCCSRDYVLLMFSFLV